MHRGSQANLVYDIAPITSDPSKATIQSQMPSIALKYSGEDPNENTKTESKFRDKQKYQSAQLTPVCFLTK